MEALQSTSTSRWPLAGYWSLFKLFFVYHAQVQDASGNTTQFKIKTQTALKKLMATYCERSGLDMQVPWSAPYIQGGPSHMSDRTHSKV